MTKPTKQYIVQSQIGVHEFQDRTYAMNHAKRNAPAKIWTHAQVTGYDKTCVTLRADYNTNPLVTIF